MFRNKVVKVTNLIAPKTTKGSWERPWESFDMDIDYGDGKVIHVTMSRVSYKVFLAEQALLKAGVDPLLLETYHGAVRDEAEYECQE
ncbi:MAG: hypothetical protein WC208_14105 [Gallionella sp.]|jgi:hypothetical protein